MIVAAGGMGERRVGPGMAVVDWGNWRNSRKMRKKKNLLGFWGLHPSRPVTFEVWSATVISFVYFFLRFPEEIEDVLYQLCSARNPKVKTEKG